MLTLLQSGVLRTHSADDQNTQRFYGIWLGLAVRQGELAALVRECGGADTPGEGTPSASFLPSCFPSTSKGLILWLDLLTRAGRQAAAQIKPQIQKQCVPNSRGWVGRPGTSYDHSGPQCVSGESHAWCAVPACVCLRIQFKHRKTVPWALGF